MASQISAPIPTFSVTLSGESDRLTVSITKSATGSWASRYAFLPGETGVRYLTCVPGRAGGSSMAGGRSCGRQPIGMNQRRSLSRHDSAATASRQSGAKNCRLARTGSQLLSAGVTPYTHSSTSGS